MIIDGRAIAEKILASVGMQVAEMETAPKMGVITCAPGLETKQYLELKLRKAKQVGIELVILELPASATTEDCIASVQQLARTATGIVVQLPLPEHIEREAVLAAIPKAQDPDGFFYGQYDEAVLPPVAGAIDAIAAAYDVSFADVHVTVVGDGRLVGQPAALYAEKKGATVTMLTIETPAYNEKIKTADILITGVGQPHFITADMVKEGVFVFDAGASEDGGQVVGDVHPEVAEKASLFTPVPGGIGPITVAILFDNLLRLIRQ